MMATRTDIGMAMLTGMRITVSTHAVQRDRLFPESRHRSARIRKKLMKRFGGEFHEKPAAFAHPDGILMHPELYAEVRRRLECDTREAEAAILGIPQAPPPAPPGGTLTLKKINDLAAWARAFGQPPAPPVRLFGMDFGRDGL
jgi:hypothetical protein